MAKHLMFEWVVETTAMDEFEEIEDCDFRNTAAEALQAMQQPAPEGYRYCFALVRNRYNRHDACDLEDRQYAYVTDGQLPEYFDDGATIPKSYREELERAMR